MVGRFRFQADSTGHASAFEEITTGVALRHAITQRDYRVTLTERRNLIGALDRLSSGAFNVLSMCFRANL